MMASNGQDTCSRQARRRVPTWDTEEPPKPSVSQLTGVFVEAPENSRGPVILSSPCNAPLLSIVMVQKGDQVEATWSIREPPQGTLKQSSDNRFEQADGTYREGHLQMKGFFLREVSSMQYGDTAKEVRTCTDTVYDLRFDAASSHLIGTRNGSPVRFAPFFIRGTGPMVPCQDVP